MFESLCVLFVFMLLLVGVHRWVCCQRDSSGHRQRKLIQAILIINILLVLIFILQCWLTEWYGRHPIASVIYVLVAFNAFSYSYFHLFNMSETGRRVRILREISGGNLKTEVEIKNVYSTKDMLKQRLSRLEDLGQLKRNSSDNYQISGYSLILAAELFRRFRKIVLGRSMGE